jgi:adenylosuccinate synthase
MIEKGKANVIIDGQWGSTGKGLLAGYLYEKYQGIDVSVCDFMPNAGHTVYLPNGEQVVSRQVPIGASFGRHALIGPHAAVDINVLKTEMHALQQVKDHGQVVIHPLASMVQEQDRKTEAEVLGRIASTLKGGHYSAVRKLMRARDAVTAEMVAPALNQMGVLVADTQEILQKALAAGGTALIETAQGFDLGLNHGHRWPYVTGRDCLVGRALDNAGASVRDVGSIIGIVRTFPIRVGNTDQGQSGPFYDDQRELTWDEVSEFAGRPVIERTTVTDRVRRVFTFSHKQLRRFLTFCRPDFLCLTHWDYLDGLTAPIKSQILRDLDEEADRHGCKLALISTGPRAKDVADVLDWQASERFEQLHGLESGTL